VIVVAAYGKILPREVLGVPQLGCINVHASLLPKYRGAAPVNWAIINGDEETGVTIMHMDKGMDTGGIIAREETEILDDDDALSVTNNLSVIGAGLLLESLNDIERKGKIESEPQDDDKATYAPMLRKEHGDIDWTMTSEEIICRMHGLSPWPAAFSKIGDTVVRLFDAERLREIEYEALANPKHRPGEVVETIKGRGPVVRTGDGYIVISAAQPAGGKPMRGPDLVNGGYVAPSMRFERVRTKS